MYIHIVAAVVFKVLYAKAIVAQCQGGEEIWVQITPGPRERYQQFGYENPEQVDVLAWAVSFSLSFSPFSLFFFIILFFPNSICARVGSINWAISGQR